MVVPGVSFVSEPELAESPAEVPAAARGDQAVQPVLDPELAEELPDLELRDGPPVLVCDPHALAGAVRRLAAGHGPVAVDTERASGYRYGQNAYLLQFRREGSGTALIDPIACPDLTELARALAGAEWILHAASQDLPCLAEVGLVPERVFDTELAGRLLGMERVGLAPMVGALLGRRMAKGHGAEDWSTRPLPESWLRYAALDVEPLIELRADLAQRLAAAGKTEWAEQEFAALALVSPSPAPNPDRWRRTSGIHRIRTRRGLAIVRSMWSAREEVAQSTDIAPGRILPDSALVAAGLAEPRTQAELFAVPGFTGRGRNRHKANWGQALQAALRLRDSELPTSNRDQPGPPPARAWVRRDPPAAERLARAREALAAASAELGVPVENIVSPQLVRNLAWLPPDPLTADAVAQFLTVGGARPWQVGIAAPLLSASLTTR